MKVSKALLGAILVGIAVQTTATSCNKKEQDKIKPQAQAEQQKQPGNQNPVPCGECPACGMG